jgi:hypothetical protein
VNSFAPPNSAPGDLLQGAVQPDNLNKAIARNKKAQAENCPLALYNVLPVGSDYS